MRAIRLNPAVDLAASIFLLFGSADAYDLRTHGSVTEQSFAASHGLARYTSEVGIAPDDVFDRPTIAPALQLADFTNLGTALGWMVEGAIREDDYQRHPMLESLFGCEPPLSPLSVIDRPKHHFFDVQRGGAGLTLAGGLPAPDWALGLQGRGPNLDENQFSLPDARVHQLRSLTESSRAERDRNTGRLFRTLGQVIHVLQDMAQPQHTRNDPHLGCKNALTQFVAGEKSWYEAYIETRALNEHYRSRSDASRPLVLSGYGSVGFQAYRDYWINASASGLAQFSSLNFFSAGTNLGTFSLAGACGGLARPVCDPQAYRTEDLDFTVPTLTGDPLVGRVRFFLRDIADTLTGQMVQNVRVSSRSLWDQHLETRQKQPKFSLNTYNYDSIADVLLPRAVGYSAGLLDYFFRGRLDVDLVSDRTDPSIVRIIGTNASSDALVEGTLTLYADDTITGTRSPLTALDSTALAGVNPGDTVASARFQIPGAGERFVAVYQGTLGSEVKQPDQNNPGGVIGKVLGGVRVEEIFSDGTQWKLRTPRGVFGLTTESGPLPATQYEVVRWGDTDSALIARTPLDAAEPIVVVFDVAREPGSSELAIGSGGTDVVLTQRKSVVFPPSVQLTTVNFTQTVAYRQHLARAEQSTTYAWVPNPPPNDAPDVNGHYVFSGSSFSPFVFEVAYEQTIPFSQSFPVMLDIPHNWDVGTVFDPYYWQLRDIGVDAAGRILGLVVVYLDEPQLAPASVPFFRLNQKGAPEQYTTATVWPYFPLQIAPLLWALVDLERGRVVASTAGPAVTIHSEVVDDEIDNSCCVNNRTFWVHSTVTYSGGPQNGTSEGSRPFSPNSIDINRSGGTIGTVTPVTLPPNGEQSLTLSGWLRDEIFQAMTARGRYTIQPVITPFDFLFVSTCDESLVCGAMHIHQPQGGVELQYPGQLLQALRPQPVGGNERLVFLALSFVDNPLAGVFGNLGDLLVWDPGLARAQFIGPELPISDHYLGSATGSAALVSSFEGTTLFRLEPTPAVEFFPDTDLTRTYTLLEPGYLYNTSDLKFHRAQPSLDATALPAALANAPGNPTGDYHTIRLVTP